MGRHDRWLSPVWMALGLGQCFESRRLGLGSVWEPESGFRPFVSGLVIIALSAILLAESSEEAITKLVKLAGLDKK
jgi:hypothetical protein